MNKQVATPHHEELRRRFYDKITFEPTSGCWLWCGAVGHGRPFIVCPPLNKSMPAHRASWVLHRGELARGHVIRACGNVMCVNPEHLFLGDNADIGRTVRRLGFRKAYASRRDVMERFISFISPEPNSGCWLWTGAGGVNGGAQFQADPRPASPIGAHRFSFSRFVGEIGPDTLICHHCDNRWCVNPDHLYAGDYISNRADMLNRKRWVHGFRLRTSCFRGHPYTDENTRLAKDGSRVCRTCSRETTRAYRARFKRSAQAETAT